MNEGKTVPIISESVINIFFVIYEIEDDSRKYPYQPQAELRARGGGGGFFGLEFRKHGVCLGLEFQSVYVHVSLQIIVKLLCVGKSNVLNELHLFLNRKY